VDGRSRVSVRTAACGWKRGCLPDRPRHTADELAQIAAFVRRRGTGDPHRAHPRHWDHALGVQAFPGVPVVAHACYLGEIERDGEVTLRFLVKNELVDAATFAFPGRLLCPEKWPCRPGPACA